jgi:hypothetical protein
LARSRGTQREQVTEAIGYIRVSTAEQADSGLSLENQRARIEAQAVANGWRLITVYEDAGVSAKTLDRPGLQAALADLRAGRVLLALTPGGSTMPVANVPAGKMMVCPGLASEMRWESAAASLA